MPKPSVMPCTAPNPSATHATPIKAPVATGSSPNMSAGGDRYTASNSRITSEPLMSDRRIAAPLIFARAATANTPGPLMFNCTDRAAGARMSRTAAANAVRMASSARSCASVSEPAAAVSATSRVRSPSAETQTESRVRGSRGAGQLVDDAQHLAGRIVRYQRLEKQTFGRGELLDGVADRAPQPVHGKVLAVDGR